MLQNVVTEIVAIRNSLLSRSVIYKRTLIIICITSVALLLLLYNYNFDSERSSYSKLLSQIISTLGINETLYLNRFSNSSVSLAGEADCNLNQKSSCFTANKSLVVTFWRESSREKWLAKNILKIFPDKHFVRIIMVHDNSIWSSFPDRDRFIWIYVNSQKRFWYVKRFLTPPILKAYKYIWILDDDVEILFEPLHYECVTTRLNISLSSPGRVHGIASHQITLVNKDFSDKIGRWTDFVEIGPIAIASASAWECIWHFMSPFVGLGWGLDLIWCRLLAHNCMSNATAEKACAVLDIFHVNHLTNYIGSTEAGTREKAAYEPYYPVFHTHQKNFAPLANDLSIYSSCTKS
jgi:hypothetical protein